jgi:HK97 family phage prohead protease
MEKKASPDLFYRSCALDRSQLDEESRTVTLSFSSETPVSRWMGDEYLLHGKKNVDLARLKSIGAALYGHNAYDLDSIVGAVSSARIDEKARRGEASITFDDDEIGAKALGKVKSGSLRGVSVGYAIHEAVRVEENEKWVDPESKREYAGPALIATRWEPYEISLTPVPADPSVGVGRAARSLDGIRIINTQTGETDMTPEEVKKIVSEAVEGLRAALPKAEDIVAQVRETLENANRPQLRVDTETLLDLTGRAAAISLECKSQVMDMALSGKTEQEMLRAIADAALGNHDAGDHGDGQNNGRSTPPAGPKLSEIDDDVLARSLKNPIDAGY